MSVVIADVEKWKAQNVAMIRKRFFIVVIPLLAFLIVALYLRGTYAATVPVALVARADSKTNSPQACVVYAQPDFTTSTLFTTGRNTLKNPGYITADNHGGFYVADYGNSRVLHYPSTTGTGTGPQPDRVYGQPDYTSNSVHHGTAGLNYPHGVAVDPNGGLYISDMFNNRMLHYPSASTVADRVYGQPDFVTTQINNGGLNADSLYHPQGIAVDSTGIYVADSANNRVFHYPLKSMIADRVYGQGWPGNSEVNFTSNTSGKGAIGLNNPRDVAVDSTGLYVVDTGNHRIVHYPLGSPIADRVYGQPDFASMSIFANQGLTEPTITTLNNPTGIALDKNSGLYVGDRDNNRVLYYPPITQSRGNDPPAVRVYGQTGYTTRDSSTTSGTFNGPGAVAVDSTGNVFVLDIFNQRVLKFVTSLRINSPPPASIVAGAFFGMSMSLQDVGSGIAFTDYAGSVTVQIKSGTGTAGATLSGAPKISAIHGIATFSSLSINKTGSGYIITGSSPGYVSADTNSFSVNSPTTTPSSTRWNKPQFPALWCIRHATAHENRSSMLFSQEHHTFVMKHPE